MAYINVSAIRKAGGEVSVTKGVTTITTPGGSITAPSGTQYIGSSGSNISVVSKPVYANGGYQTTTTSYEPTVVKTPQPTTISKPGTSVFAADGTVLQSFSKPIFKAGMINPQSIGPTKTITSEVKKINMYLPGADIKRSTSTQESSVPSQPKYLSPGIFYKDVQTGQQDVVIPKKEITSSISTPGRKMEYTYEESLGPMKKLDYKLAKKQVQYDTSPAYATTAALFGLSTLKGAITTTTDFGVLTPEGKLKLPLSETFKGTVESILHPVKTVQSIQSSPVTSLGQMAGSSLVLGGLKAGVTRLIRGSVPSEVKLGISDIKGRLTDVKTSSSYRYDYITKEVPRNVKVLNKLGLTEKQISERPALIKELFVPKDISVLTTRRIGPTSSEFTLSTPKKTFGYYKQIVGDKNYYVNYEVYKPTGKYTANVLKYAKGDLKKVGTFTGKDVGYLKTEVPTLLEKSFKDILTTKTLIDRKYTQPYEMGAQLITKDRKLITNLQIAGGETTAFRAQIKSQSTSLGKGPVTLVEKRRAIYNLYDDTVFPKELQTGGSKLFETTNKYTVENLLKLGKKQKLPSDVFKPTQRVKQPGILQEVSSYPTEGSITTRPNPTSTRSTQPSISTKIGRAVNIEKNRQVLRKDATNINPMNKYLKEQLEKAAGLPELRKLRDNIGTEKIITQTKPTPTNKYIKPSPYAYGGSKYRQTLTEMAPLEVGSKQITKVTLKTPRGISSLRPESKFSTIYKIGSTTRTASLSLLGSLPKIGTRQEVFNKVEPKISNILKPTSIVDNKIINKVENIISQEVVQTTSQKTSSQTLLRVTDLTTFGGSGFSPAVPTITKLPPLPIIGFAALPRGYGFGSRKRGTREWTVGNKIKALTLGSKMTSLRGKI